MKTTMLFFLFPLFFIIDCSKQIDVNQERQQIEQLISQYSATFDQKDFSTFATYCTEDMHFYTLDGQDLDRVAMMNFLNRILTNWRNMHTTIDELSIDLDSELAWARYKSSMTYSTSDQTGVMHNLTTVIFRKTESNWKIAHYHMSTNYD